MKETDNYLFKICEGCCDKNHPLSIDILILCYLISQVLITIFYKVLLYFERQCNPFEVTLLLALLIKEHQYRDVRDGECDQRSLWGVRLPIQNTEYLKISNEQDSKQQFESILYWFCALY